MRLFEFEYDSKVNQMEVIESFAEALDTVAAGEEIIIVVTGIKDD